MSYNEQEAFILLIGPVLRDKGCNDHRRARMEAPAPVVSEALTRLAKAVGYRVSWR
jgi:hypothetical protein